MKKNRNTKQLGHYQSDLLNDLLDSISPEEQKLVDRKMMLAATIYDAMKAKGWNQSQFAEAMGKKPSEISKWLSGTHSFNTDTLWKIGDLLGVNFCLWEHVNDQSAKQIVYSPIFINPSSVGSIEVKIEHQVNEVLASTTSYNLQGTVENHSVKEFYSYAS